MNRIALLLTAAATLAAAAADPLDRERLVAWCIVPFDAAERGPEQRARMLKELGLTRCAYDWRRQHVNDFEAEILAYQRHGIEFFAFWSEHPKAFELFEKHDLAPQIWRTAPSPEGPDQAARVIAAADAMEALAEKCATLGSKFGLYNHGGWGGQPENLLAVCEELHRRGHDHVGIVYNWHHAHDRIDDWPQVLEMLEPHLLCLNLNGMNPGAEPKILPLGQGRHEKAMLRTLIDSDYDGPIGILDHRHDTDAKLALEANLKGLETLREQLAASGALAPGPLEPGSHPHHDAWINRDRVYDFYAKQARRFSAVEPLPETLPPYPGLDGPGHGHWGNQNDQDIWKDARIREMDHGPMVSAVFRGDGKTIPRGIGVSLGDDRHAVFNPESLAYELLWHGEFIAWSDVRRGFLHGAKPAGETAWKRKDGRGWTGRGEFLGVHRAGDRVGFAYRIDDTSIIDTLELVDGKPRRVIHHRGPRPEPLRDSPPLQWNAFDGELPPEFEPTDTTPLELTTRGKRGAGRPYAIDTLTLPADTASNSLFFIGGFDFLGPRKIALCTIHGEVWTVEWDDDSLAELRWSRFARGLHQPLGLKVADGVIHVMGRDQLIALHDRNDDGVADHHECVSMAHRCSAGGHDFITGLERDDAGRWYFASGKQGLCRLSPDGDELEVLATGFRNPNGLGITPDGSTILTSVQEGNWTPASAICEVVEGGHYGLGGPREGPLGYVPPLLYLPRGADHSSGGQTHIDSDRWGPVRGSWLHFSFGNATHFLVHREELDGRAQAVAIPLRGEFLSGAHRGRFSPHDGQLYVAGSQGWGSYGVRDGSLQRVRHTGGAFPYPVDWETRANGVLLSFADPIGSTHLERDRWFAQQWNYLYGPAYGSPERSVRHPDRDGHDPLAIHSIQRLDDHRLFVEIPQLQPVHQFHLHFNGDGGSRFEAFATLHALGEPFTGFDGYTHLAKRFISRSAGEAPDALDAETLIHSCTACHHPLERVVGPSFAEIRTKYAGNPAGIVQWAMDPAENRNPELPPMPSFAFLGEERLRAIAEHILAPGR